MKSSITVPAQIERRRSNKQKWFFGAVEFKFEPNMTVLIKNLAQKVDFWANCRSNQDCRSICAGTVGTKLYMMVMIVLLKHTLKYEYSFLVALPSLMRS